MDFRDAGAVDGAFDALNVSLDHLVKLVEDVAAALGEQSSA